MSDSHESPGAIAALLVGAVRRGASPEGGSWLEAQVARAALPDGRAELRLAFASAGRRLTSKPLPAPEPPLSAALMLQLSGRTLDEAGRMALVFAAVAALGPDVAAQETLVGELFLRGGPGEQQAILRALPLLPEPARYVELAVGACRSSVQTIFEAIACENAYPAAHFSDEPFNQMVLKAMFNAVPTARIAGLSQRAGKELARMAEGYGAERRAAGRSVPADIEIISALVRSKP